MPVDPFTHNHRRHPIANNDCYIDANGVEHDASCRHDDQPVTVADLLDAYEDGAVPREDFRALLARADDDTRWSYDQIDTLLNAYAGLSPSERAEFDRRTGADRD